MFCPHCGEENADNTQYCRRCGERLPDAGPVPAGVVPSSPVRQPSSTLAIVALVLACLGVVTCVTSVPGLIVGIIALVAARRDPLKTTGEGLAIAAIAVSGVILVLGLLYVAFVGFAAARMMPALTRARGEALKSADRGNLHNIGLGIAMYSSDEDGSYPGSLADLLGGGGYIADSGVLVSPADPMPQNLPDGTPCSYAYIGALLDSPPGRAIIAYTRKGVFPDGRNVAYADMTVEWHGEEDLAGPDGLLAESYALVAKWLGGDLTAERDAELREFYGIED